MSATHRDWGALHNKHNTTQQNKQKHEQRHWGERSQQRNVKRNMKSDMTHEQHEIETQNSDITTHMSTDTSMINSHNLTSSGWTPPPNGPTLHASHSVGVPSAHSNGCTSHQPASTRRAPHSTHTKHTGTHNVHHTATAQVPHTPVPTRPRVAPIPSNRSTTSLAHGRWLASTRTHSRSSAARGGRLRCNTPPSPASLSAASISCPLRGYVSGGLATPPSACTGAIQENTAVHPCASCQ